MRKFVLFGYALACLLALALYNCSFIEKRHLGAATITENMRIYERRNVSDLNSRSALSKTKFLIEANPVGEWRIEISKINETVITDTHVRSQCITHESTIFAEMQYSSIGNTQFRFFVSLHDPLIDTVVSKGIQEGTYGSKHRYPSVDEMHAICEHGMDPESGYQANCGQGGVFVEVGSAIGMVALYAASRGMKVYAFDPLRPNIDRIRESLCLNGEKECLATHSLETSECLGPPSMRSKFWGSFSPSNFILHENLVGSKPEGGRKVESEPGNLAATMRGGGSFQTNVTTVTIDESVPDAGIDVLLLTCQGYEFDVRHPFLPSPLHSRQPPPPHPPTPIPCAPSPPAARVDGRPYSAPRAPRRRCRARWGT